MRPFAFAVLVLALAAPIHLAAQEQPRVLIQRGERYLAMGKLDAAALNYGKVLACCEGTPEAAEAHNDLGVCHMRRGEKAAAEAEYRKSLAINGYPLAAFNLGKLRYEEFLATRDPSARAEAGEMLTRFRDYLTSGRELPPVVAYNRDEIDAYLSETLAALENAAAGK